MCVWCMKNACTLCVCVYSMCVRCIYYMCASCVFVLYAVCLCCMQLYTTSGRREGIWISGRREGIWISCTPLLTMTTCEWLQIGGVPLTHTIHQLIVANYQVVHTGQCWRAWGHNKIWSHPLPRISEISLNISAKNGKLHMFPGECQMSLRPSHNCHRWLSPSLIQLSVKPSWQVQSCKTILYLRKLKSK